MIINITSFVLISWLEKDHSMIVSLKKCCYFFPNNFMFYAVKKDDTHLFLCFFVQLFIFYHSIFLKLISQPRSTTHQLSKFLIDIGCMIFSKHFFSKGVCFLATFLVEFCKLTKKKLLSPKLNFCQKSKNLLAVKSNMCKK